MDLDPREFAEVVDNSPQDAPLPPPLKIAVDGQLGQDPAQSSAMPIENELRPLMNTVSTFDGAVNKVRELTGLRFSARDHPAVAQFIGGLATLTPERSVDILREAANHLSQRIPDFVVRERFIDLSGECFAHQLVTARHSDERLVRLRAATTCVVFMLSVWKQSIIRPGGVRRMVGPRATVQRRLTQRTARALGALPRNLDLTSPRDVRSALDQMNESTSTSHVTAPGLRGLEKLQMTGKGLYRFWVAVSQGTRDWPIRRFGRGGRRGVRPRLTVDNAPKDLILTRTGPTGRISQSVVRRTNAAFLRRKASMPVTTRAARALVQAQPDALQALKTLKIAAAISKRCKKKRIGIRDVSAALNVNIVV